MKSLVAAGAAVALAFALPAAAQTSSSTHPNTGANMGAATTGATGTGSSPSSSSSSTGMTGSSTGMTGHGSPVAARMKSELEQSGFSDVKIMPKSFLVRAKDKDGHPVMMIVNPDSLTAVTALGTSGNMGNGSSANGTTGSSMGAGSAGSSSSHGFVGRHEHAQRLPGRPQHLGRADPLSCREAPLRARGGARSAWHLAASGS